MGGNYRGAIQLTNPSADRNPDAKVHPLDDLVGRTIGISRDRLIGDGALEERVRIVNHAASAERITLELELGYDGADIFEVRGYPRPARGTLLPVAVTPDRVTFRYDGLDGVRRSTHVAFSEPATKRRARSTRDRPTRSTPAAAVRLRWELDLEPGARRRAATGPSWAQPRRRCRRRRRPIARRAPAAEVAALFPEPPHVSGDEGAAAYHAWERGHDGRRQRPRAVQPRHQALGRATCGCSSTRAPARTSATSRPACRGSRRCSAGTPIIAALQSLAFRPQLAVETLSVLAAYQATEVDDWRDAEPGKILHELRTGEMAGAGELPHTPYYGSVDSTPLWLILLGDDLRLDRRPRAARPAVAERAGRARLDRSTTATATATGSSSTSAARERGLLNQGWKDSERRDPRPDRRRGRAADRAGRGPGLRLRREAPDGRARPRPRRRSSSPTAARRRGREPCASASRRAFWVEDQRYYAMALDARQAPGATRSARTPASACGPGSSRRTGPRDVVERLLDPVDVLGLGDPDLRAGQPGYNPIGYHTGHGLAARHVARSRPGMKRYGFDDAANRLVGRVLEAAQRFPEYRLPGAVLRLRPRGRRTIPVPYPVACSPQAWAAGVVVPVPRRRCSGCAAHADRNELELRHPHLPDWLGKVDAHEPARRRGVGRPALPPLARDDERRGAAQGRRPVDVTIRL